MRTPGFTRYSVRRGRKEIRKERRSLWIRWTLVAVACALILVFVYLLLVGGQG